MSGICGVFNYSGAGRADREVLQKMLDTLAHRGPDGSRLYAAPDGSFGMGHQLLAHKPLDGKNFEPFSDESGKVWAATDGRVSNYETLRAELERGGRKFKSNLDAELILHLYLERGEDFVKAIDGTSCAAVYDAGRKRLILVRDRLGVRSLYYVEAGGCIVFGSEIRALLAHPAVKRECEPLALMDFLYCRHRVAPLTMFKDVRKLRNSEVVTFDPPYGGRRERQYWTPLNGEVMRDKDEAFFVEGIRERFSNAVKAYMRTNKKAGAFLSGGLDSSSVVAVMSEFSAEPIETFTLGFKAHPDDPPDELNELPYAKRVAGHFGTVHHEGWIYGRDYLPGLKEVIANLEDLSLASEQVMLLHAAKMARERGVSLVLTGEGGIDEYMGSGTYMFMFNALRGKWSKLRKSPLFFRKFLFWTMERLKYGRPDGECYSYPREWLWWLANDSGLFLMEGMMMSEMFLRRLMSGDFLKAHRGASPVRYWDPCYAEIRESLPNAELMQEMAYCDWRTLISDILNMEDDKLGSALGMDIWPAIDPSLAEFLFRIPAEMKVAGGESKQLFKKAMDGKVPHDIAYRKKGGFSTVMVKFFHDTYPHYLRDAIEDSNLKASGVFNMERVEELIRLHESGKVDYTWPLLGLLMLFLWHRRWIE